MAGFQLLPRMAGRCATVENRMSISENGSLIHLVIGTTYGGDGVNTFALPNLQSRMPVHQGTGSTGTQYIMGALGSAEGIRDPAHPAIAVAHSCGESCKCHRHDADPGEQLVGVHLSGAVSVETAPTQTMNNATAIGVAGGEPATFQSSAVSSGEFYHLTVREFIPLGLIVFMGTPYLAEIRLFSFNFAPKGWAFCNGQILADQSKSGAFCALGTNYGGNGVNTFQLPNRLQGRIPNHFGNGYVVGQFGGEEYHTLISNEMPIHNHVPQCAAPPPCRIKATPKNNLWVTQTTNAYAIDQHAGAQVMSPSAIALAGGGQPHENRPPYLVLNFCIALQGIFSEPEINLCHRQFRRD